MVLLDGVYFDTISLTSRPSLEEFASFRRSTVGYIVRTKQQVVSNERAYSTNVDAEQRLRLENLLANALVPFNFVDETGFSWLITAGVDDATHAYGTGAYFMPHTRLNFIEQSGKDSRDCQNWNVDFTILVNARGVRKEVDS